MGLRLQHNCWIVSSPYRPASSQTPRMGPHIVRNEGPLVSSKGVDASMARQLVYSGVSWHEILWDHEGPMVA